MTSRVLLPVLIVGVLILSACHGVGASYPLQDTSGTRSRLVVFAAASLSEAFTDIGAGFESRHPDVQVSFNYAGSQQLAHQLAHGAPADVFASADQRQMQAVIQSGFLDAGAVKVFANNRLVVIFPDDNPANIRDLGDLARPGLKLGLADSAVPVGQYSIQFLERASLPGRFGSGYKDAVLGNVVSFEENVRAVLSKVYLGEVDGGITYASDILSLGPVSGSQIGSLDIPNELNIQTSYYIAQLDHSTQKDLGAMFLDYVFSKEGQEILSMHDLIIPASGQIGAE